MKLNLLLACTALSLLLSPQAHLQASDSEDGEGNPYVKIKSPPTMIRQTPDVFCMKIRNNRISVDLWNSLPFFAGLTDQNVEKKFKALEASLEKDKKSQGNLNTDQLRDLFTYTLCLQEGIGCPKTEENAKTARDILKKTAKRGGMEATFYLGLTYYVGQNGLQKDIPNSAHFFKKLEKLSPVSKKLLKSIEPNYKGTALLEIEFAPFQIKHKKSTQSVGQIFRRNQLEQFREKHQHTIQYATQALTYLGALEEMKTDLETVDFYLGDEIYFVEDLLQRFNEMDPEKKEISELSALLEKAKELMCTSVNRAKQAQKKWGQRNVLKSSYEGPFSSNIAPTISTTKEARMAAQELLEKEKSLNKAKQKKNHRATKKDPSRVKKNHSSKKENHKSPFLKTVYVKKTRSIVPQTSMNIVIHIRNIMHQVKNLDALLNELHDFTYDIDLKEVSPKYAGIPEASIVYQLKINDQFRLFIPFIYDQETGKYIVYKDTIIIDDRHVG